MLILAKTASWTAIAALAGAALGRYWLVPGRPKALPVVAAALAVPLLGVADLWLAQDEAGCVEGNVHAANSSRICMTRWPASVPALAVSSPISLKPTLANTLREPALLSKARDRRAG